MENKKESHSLKKLKELSHGINFEYDQNGINKLYSIIQTLKQNDENFQISKGDTKETLDIISSVIENSLEKTVSHLVKEEINNPNIENRQKLEALYNDSIKLSEISNRHNQYDIFDMGLNAYYKNCQLYSNEKISQFFIDTFEDPKMLSKFVSSVDDYKMLTIDSVFRHNHPEIYNDPHYDVIHSLLDEKRFGKIMNISGIEFFDIDGFKPAKTFPDHVDSEDLRCHLAILSLVSGTDKLDDVLKTRSFNDFMKKIESKNDSVTQSIRDEVKQKLTIEDLKNKNKKKLRS